jgi:hypothetical protein
MKPYIHYNLVYLIYEQVVNILNIPSSVQVTISVMYLSQFLLHIYAALVTPSVVTYLRYENIHITFVYGNKTRIDVMARPKSSQCTFTSANTPINVLELHIIAVIMYVA